jgi:hypothetical protein
MPQDLEYPGAGGVGDWDSLYRARGDEVLAHRSIFTGDVFADVEVQSIGESKVLPVMILQHPCALRIDGINLQPRLIVAEVQEQAVIPASQWKGNFRKMPLPDLKPSGDPLERNQVSLFTEIYMASPESLGAATRVACMSQRGVNLLLQRWVHHNSRAVIPTWQFQEVSSGAFEEADLIEEWCDDRTASIDMTIQDATVEAMKWLREDGPDGVMRQRHLDDPQKRSTVRKEMRAKLRSL